MGGKLLVTELPVQVCLQIHSLQIIQVYQEKYEQIGTVERQKSTVNKLRR